MQSNDPYLQGLSRKDPKVLRDIYREFFPMIRRHITQNQGSDADAEDVFQNALEAIYLKARDNQLVLTAAFSTYLFEVCRRQWLKQLRPRKFQSGVTIDDPSVSNIVEETMPVVEQTERYQLLRDMFARLQEDCRRLLALSWQTEKNMEEVAAELGMTYAYARKRKTICKDRLVDLIKNDARYKELSA